MAISNFVPQIWSAEILLKLRANLKFAQPGIINRNYEGDVDQAGKTVNITDFNDVTVANYAPNSTSLTYQTLTDNTRQLVISQNDYFAFSVDDVDRRQALPGFIAVATQGAAYNLAYKTDAYVSHLMLTAAQVAVGTGGATPALQAVSMGGESYKTTGTNPSLYDELVALKVALDKAFIPDDGSRFVIMSPDAYAYLLRDQRFVTQKDAGSTVGLRNGVVGQVLNMNVVVSATIPLAGATWDATNFAWNSGTGTAKSAQVLAGHPMATTFAEQIVETEAIRLQNSFADAVRGLHVYGGLVVRPQALQVALLNLA